MNTTVLARLFVLFLATFSLIGCRPVGTTSASPTGTSVSTKETLQPGASSETPSPAVPANGIVWVDRCASFVDSIQPQVSGKIAAVEYGSKALLIDIQSREVEYLTGEIYNTISVSPDYNQLAYLDTSRNEIDVVGSDGRVLRTLAVSPSWRRVLRWLDNQQLLVENFGTRTEGILKLSSAIMIDVASGERREYLPKYPNILDVSDPIVHWEQYSTINAVYSNDLSLVIYPAQEPGESPLILWSLSEERELGRIHSGGYYFPSAPQWSPDGSKFVVSAFPVFAQKGFSYNNASDGFPYLGGADLFSLDRAGNVERLTFLTTRYQAKETGYAWSPDEDSIAFWLSIDKDTPELAVLDLISGEIARLCISGGAYGINSPMPPIWSPDGNYLAVSIPNVQKQPDIVIVDIERQTAARVAQNAEAMGWLLDTR